MIKTRRCIHRGVTWKRTSGAAARASAAVMCTMCHLLPEGVGKALVRDPRQTSTGVYLTPLLPTNILAPACKASDPRPHSSACRCSQHLLFHDILTPEHSCEHTSTPFHLLLHAQPDQDMLFTWWPQHGMCMQQAAAYQAGVVLGLPLLSGTAFHWMVQSPCSLAF